MSSLSGCIRSENSCQAVPYVLHRTLVVPVYWCSSYSTSTASACTVDTSSSGATQHDCLYATDVAYMQSCCATLQSYHVAAMALLDGMHGATVSYHPGNVIAATDMLMVVLQDRVLTALYPVALPQHVYAHIRTVPVGTVRMWCMHSCTAVLDATQ